MQFIQNGPDIPEALLQAHEEGRVVFFCGAGISRPAGLPGFPGLVDEIFHHVGEYRDALEEERICTKQFDQAIGRFEDRVQGGRRNVRRWLPDILKPNPTKRHALASHFALLTLGRSRDNGLRLVTTNFDTLFEMAAERYSLPAFTIYPDPPMRSRWEGLVYLHGRMSASPTDDELDRLILSDGDFGQAYLTQGWAARFVATLFRDCTLCFVGYGIDDPVLRYMTAAHALGDGAQEMFAFAGFSGGQASLQKSAWRAKNVTPILYDEADSHRSLHRTLHVWASVHRDGVRGRERIVSRLARRHPDRSRPENDFVGRMLWALSDDSGLPARRFAEFDPVPSLDWLKALDEDRYRQGDLPRFDVQAGSRPDDKLAFSLTHRPAPYHRAPWMCLVSHGGVAAQWDAVMFPIAHWLTRHLDDPELMLWLLEHGGTPDSQFIRSIDNQLDNLARLEREGNTAELDRLRANAPNAIPRPRMRTLWRLLIAGRVKSSAHDFDLYQWSTRLQTDGLTVTLRLELRKLLAPMVKLRRPFSWGEDLSEGRDDDELQKCIDCEFELATDNVYSTLYEFRQSDAWHVALPALLNEFEQLLRDALDLMHAFGEASEQKDPSQWLLPSLGTQRQLPGFREWVVLVELLRDAWLAIRQSNPIQARYVALGWFVQPYLTFRRLALFAAAHEGVGLYDEWVDCLLAEEGRYLWAGETERETNTLLSLHGAQLSDAVRERLERAILNGPQRDYFRSGIDPEKIACYTEEMIWERLAKLASSGCQLGIAARTRFKALSGAHPEWKLSVDVQDGSVPLGMGSGHEEFERQRRVEEAPRRRHDLAAWLRREPAMGFFDEDNWRETCQQRFFVSACALCDLAHENCWPAKRWREALQAWSDDTFAQRAWRFLAPRFRDMPEPLLVELAPTLSWWLKAVAKVLDRHEDVFLELCRRIFALPDQGGVDAGDSVMQAINHPVGHVAEALLDFWFRRDPNDNDGLPADLEPLLTQLCDTAVDRYRHGRVLMASRLIALFRVDSAWTAAHLLPLFNWSCPAEAQSLWRGFLWFPRLYRPLLAAFKADFLGTARHYAELGEHAGQYVTLLTYAALDAEGVFAPRELYETFNDLPREGLPAAAQALVRALEGAGKQREPFWINRIQPFWQKVWPKSKSLASVQIAEQLARLAVAAGGEFPAALNAVKAWLCPLAFPDHVVRRLHQSELCARFPQEALQLMAAIIDDRSMAPTHLGECLSAVAQVWPGARHDPDYQRLTEYLRKRSGP